jgi:hypothetical protein
MGIVYRKVKVLKLILKKQHIILHLPLIKDVLLLKIILEFVSRMRKVFRLILMDISEDASALQRHFPHELIRGSPETNERKLRFTSGDESISASSGLKVTNVSRTGRDSSYEARPRQQRRDGL